MTMTRPAPMSQAERAAKSPTGPAPKTTTTSPSVMSPSWPEISRREGVGEEHRVLVVHPFGNDRRPDVGKGHPDVFRLGPVIAAAGMGVPVDPSYRGCVGVDVVAEGI